jgi:choline dehydrogenase-like flavoprotein
MIICSSEILAGDVLEAQVVVVGSGAAGIPLSLELAEYGLDVILLEAGSESLDPRAQSLYSGKLEHPSLHPPADKYRQRRLGGTTPIWGGRCVPLDPIDFAERQYVPFSGWPISMEDLSPFYPAANDWLEAGDFAYRNEDVFSDSVPPMVAGFESDVISLDSLERFSRPTDVFARYKSRLQESSNIRVVSEANCINVSLHDNAKSVKQLVLKTFDRNEFYVRARYYVLATGGIETARLLLASNDVCEKGVGNEHDVVGRYYMCHIAGNVGKLRFNLPSSDIRHGYETSPDGIYCRRRISLFETEQFNKGVNNVVLRLHFPRIGDPAHKSGVLSLIYLLKPFISYEYATRLRDSKGDSFVTMLQHLKNVLLSPFEISRFGLRWIPKRILASRKFPSIILENKTNMFSLEANGEQCPNHDSRIYLADELDELGLRRVVVDWKYSMQDVNSVKITLRIFRQELERLGIGQLEFDEESLEDDLLRFGALGGHHIGTARMGTDPSKSVVDRNCKVHNVDNLYIAGSAVFPTSGQANPTLTITALAVRLADHLAHQDQVCV